MFATGVLYAGSFTYPHKRVTRYDIWCHGWPRDGSITANPPIWELLIKVLTFIQLNRVPLLTYGANSVSCLLFFYIKVVMIICVYFVAL